MRAIGLTTGQSYALVGAAELPPNPVVNGAVVANLEAKLYPPQPIVPPGPIKPRGVELGVNLIFDAAGNLLASSQALVDD